MLITLTRRLLTLVVALLISVTCSKADDRKLWQGAFTTSSLSGAMEMITMGDDSKQEARISFALDGRPVNPVVDQLKISATAISFLVTLSDRHYQFTGLLRNNQWRGAMSAAGDPSEKGTWKLILLDLKNAVSNPNDPLPTVTGPNGVGRTAFHWVDNNRAEIETRAPDDKRELLVYLFYPSEISKTAGIAPYIPDADLMRDVWRDELTDRLKRIRPHSRESVAFTKGKDRFPVVIFAPGNGQKALSYATLLEDLASHGFVVAAIDPPYNAPAIHFPDGKVLRRPAPADRGWDRPRNREEFVRMYREQVVHWARDMSFVLDCLTTLDKGDGIFSHRLDLTRVGAFGHSRGGQAAGTVRLLDPRFLGGVNLDGNEAGKGFQPVSGSDGGKQPFLWIEDQFQRPTERDLQQAGLTEAQLKEIFSEGDRQLQSIKGGGLRITILRLGSGHMDFSDNPFWDAAATPEYRAGKLRTLAITRAYLLAFFNGCLRNQWRGLRNLTTDAGKNFPDVSVRKFGALWPQ